MEKSCDCWNISFRKLLEDTSYDNAEKAEAFLKGYSYPMVQLNPLKTILVISHNNNTFDKRQMIGQERRFAMKKTNYKLKNIIKNKYIRAFYKIKSRQFYLSQEEQKKIKEEGIKKLMNYRKEEYEKIIKKQQEKLKNKNK